MNKRPGLADAHLAALRLIALPEKYEDLTQGERDFLCSDIVGQLLDGEWPGVFMWIRGSKWLWKSITKQ